MMGRTVVTWVGTLRCPEVSSCIVHGTVTINLLFNNLFSRDTQFPGARISNRAGGQGSNLPNTWC